MASIDKDLDCEEVMDYVSKTLSRYQLFPKKWYRNGQDSEPISVLGMLYDPKHDTIQAKQLSFSDGKKIRGELKSLQEELVIVKTSDDNAKEKKKNILQNYQKRCKQYFRLPIHSMILQDLLCHYIIN